MNGQEIIKQHDLLSISLEASYISVLTVFDIYNVSICIAHRDCCILRPTVNSLLLDLDHHSTYFMCTRSQGQQDTLVMPLYIQSYCSMFT